MSGKFQQAENIPLTVAVDFDGCICGYAFPECGPPNWEVIYALRHLVDMEWHIIIHSSRVNSHWDPEECEHKTGEMLEYLSRHGVPFHAVWGVDLISTSLGRTVREHPYDFRFRGMPNNDVGKPVAHVYLDDRALCPQEVVRAVPSPGMWVGQRVMEACMAMAESVEREHAKSTGVEDASPEQTPET